MILEELIEHEEKESKATWNGKPTLCAENHRQLAEWLKELKQLREQTRWIPVSERLPKVNTEVLVQFERNMAVGFYHFGWWHVNTGNGFYTSILTSEDQPIAWMPLPEPYKASPTGAERSE